MLATIFAFINAAIIQGIPLLFGATGEIITEKSGTLNLGIPGIMYMGGAAGVIVFILVFLVGHTFNIAINLLGAYVHTNRLQYVEFFGKFYEGGGEKYAPFAANTKFYTIKEEN